MTLWLLLNDATSCGGGHPDKRCRPATKSSSVACGTFKNSFSHFLNSFSGKGSYPCSQEKWCNAKTQTDRQDVTKTNPQCNHKRCCSIKHAATCKLLLTSNSIVLSIHFITTGHHHLGQLFWGQAYCWYNVRVYRPLKDGALGRCY